MGKKQKHTSDEDKAARKAEKEAAKEVSKAARKAEKEAAKAARKAEKEAERAAAKANNGDGKPAKPPSLLERRLAALSLDAAVTDPTMPVAQALLEADRVHREAKRARDRFAKLAGFDLEHLDGLRELAGALDDAEDAWKRLRLDKKSSPLGLERREAEDLRAAAIASGRYLLRHDAAAQAELDHIQEGEGLADLIQDLRDLQRFIASHGEAFAEDLHLPDGASTRMGELAELLAAGADNDEGNRAQVHRNRCFWVLQHAVGEVRAAARYLFADKPKRLAVFAAAYAARRPATRAAAATPASPPASPPPAASPATP